VIYWKRKVKEEWENKIKGAEEKYKELQYRLHEKYKKEIQDFIQNFEKKYPKPLFIHVKEINVLKKTLSALLREKNYVKAQDIQTKIKELEAIKPAASVDYIKTKNDKLKKEVAKLKKKKTRIRL